MSTLTARLDESASRSPTWREGAWVTLSDGQRWSIRKPCITFGVGKDAGGKTVGKAVISYDDPGLDDLVKTIVGNAQAHINAKIGNLLALMAGLLQRDYRLSLDDVNRLLTLDIETSAGQDLLISLFNIVCGNAPEYRPDTKGPADARARSEPPAPAPNPPRRRRWLTLRKPPKR